MAGRKEKSYENPFDDYSVNNQKIVDKKGQQCQEFTEKIKLSCESMINKLNSSLRSLETDDYSVYTGTSGIALLYFHIANKLKKPDYFQKALSLLQKCIPQLKGRRVSFLNGDSGPLALGSVLYHQLGMKEDSKKLLRRLEGMLPDVVSLKTDIPDEVLYGRAGYLFSLLFVNKYMGEGTIDPNIIKKVVSAILKSGKLLAAREKHSVPLMYIWHEKYYLGAAHGIAGILFMLLQARKYMSESDVETAVRPTIDYLQSLRFPSGNFPSSVGNGSDRLVQWCHGAPGMVDLFLLAHKVFRDDSYLQTAVNCGDVVWKNGILRKSYGICHGVAGNGYTFVSLLRAVKEPAYLYEACKFAEWCTSYGKYQNRDPDRPLSLFEGLAGVIYFMTDMLHPEDASFPAYTLEGI